MALIINVSAEFLEGYFDS